MPNDRQLCREARQARVHPRVQAKIRGKGVRSASASSERGSEAAARSQDMIASELREESKELPAEAESQSSDSSRRDVPPVRG